MKLVIIEGIGKKDTIKKYLGSEYEVVASKGHVRDLPVKKIGVSPKNNFEPQYTIMPDKKEIVTMLKNKASKADKIYLAADPDRSGAYIAWSLLEYAQIPRSKAARMTTHEITPKAVLYALEHPVEFEETLVYAEKARQCTDKLLGYAASPQAKKHIGAKSVGRCQSVGLMLVADRENEILDFIPEKYFNLYLNFTKNDKEFKAKYVGYKNEKYDKIKNASEIKTIKYKTIPELIALGVIQDKKITRQTQLKH